MELLPALNYLAFFLVFAGIFAVMALGLNLQWGATGLFNVGVAGFVAVGAYASAYALTTGNFNLVTIRVARLVSGDIFLEPNMAAALAVILMVLLGAVTAANQWLLKKSYVNKGQSHA